MLVKSLSQSSKSNMVQAMAKQLLKNRPFQVKVKKSNIEGAGQGLFAAADLQAGTPICLYPGYYFPPLPQYMFLNYDGSCVQDASFLCDPDQDNGYILIMKEFGGFLDARYSKQELPIFCGHKINHCPLGTIPNVDGFEFAWRDMALKSSFNPVSYTEYPWYIDPATEEPVYASELSNQNLPGYMFYTRRSIEYGEEILWDYQIVHGERKFPWYHAVSDS